MVTELRDLLHDAADAPRSDAVDTDVLLGQAKRRVARRRRSGIASACVTVAAVTLIAGVLTKSDPSPPPRPPAQPDPSRISENSLTNAPVAVAGEDYRVLTTYDVRSLAGSSGRVVEAMTQDAKAIYRDGPDGTASASEIGLLDPQTGNTTALPDAIAQIGANRIISDDTMIAGASYGVPAAAVWYFDTGTQEWGTFGMEDLAAGGITGIDPASATVSRIQFLTDAPDELFLSVRPSDKPNSRARLVSVTLGAGQTPADLGPVDHGQVSLWAIASGILASMPNAKVDPDTITLVDLTTGAERTVGVPDSNGCTVEQIWMRVDRLIALQECLVRGGAMTRLNVFDLDGSSLDEVEAPSFEVISTANNLMMLRSNDPPGLFLYDLTNGDLVRLTRHDSTFTDVGAGEQTYWTFSEPIQRGSGLRIVVADFGN